VRPSNRPITRSPRCTAEGYRRAAASAGACAARAAAAAAHIGAVSARAAASAASEVLPDSLFQHACSLLGAGPYSLDPPGHATPSSIVPAVSAPHVIG
jgi:hypothetical protein